ncbi:MAG: DEAD/DEAH box helicase, partial [Roseomonas sp.]|nr:DEAD/DEAH box helicase [Roseomonas sp.]
MPAPSRKQPLLPATISSSPAKRLRVLLPLPLADAYDYRVADEAPPPGSFVAVPLGGRQVIGVVWDEARDSALPDHRLKPIAAVLEAPPMPEKLRRFVDWVAAYTLSPRGAVLRMAMSVPAALEAQPHRAGWCRADPLPELPRLTPARQRVLAALPPSEVRAPDDLARDAGVGAAVLRGMADAGLLVPGLLPPLEDFRPPDLARPGPVLDHDQAEAATLLRAAVARDTYSTTLLSGVTGSGKTEVYFEAIAAALQAGRQALVLLPEIALSAQWLDRFRARFGTDPALWHSELSPRTRRITWRAVAEGRAPVLVGARSSLFLPFPDLGLIVVDEEHETAFKQEDGVIYHARDMAVVRARLSDAA